MNSRTPRGSTPSLDPAIQTCPPPSRKTLLRTVPFRAAAGILAAAVAAGEDGRFTLLNAGPATSGGALTGDSAAEICLGPGGTYAYVGVRGSNLISVLEVGPDGTDLSPIKDIASGGNWPRHHLVRGRWLHVAHERSGDVATFELDPATGLPGPVLQVLKTPSPTALVPAS